VDDGPDGQSVEDEVGGDGIGGEVLSHEGFPGAGAVAIGVASSEEDPHEGEEPSDPAVDEETEEERRDVEAAHLLHLVHLRPHGEADLFAVFLALIEGLLLDLDGPDLRRESTKRNFLRARTDGAQAGSAQRRRGNLTAMTS